MFVQMVRNKLRLAEITIVDLKLELVPTEHGELGDLVMTQMLVQMERRNLKPVEIITAGRR